jgi:hypothetical protein
MPPNSDFIEKRIIFINDTMIESRIIAHGPSLTELQLQRDWYRGVLRESLQIAAHTIYNPRKRAASPASQANELSSLEGPKGSIVQTQGYDMSTIPAPHQSQVGYLSNEHPKIPLQQGTFFANDQQHTKMVATWPNHPHGIDPFMDSNMEFPSARAWGEGRMSDSNKTNHGVQPNGGHGRIRRELLRAFHCKNIYVVY